jgi:hypothetical protein
MHLGQALRAESVTQTAYPGTMAPAPFATTQEASTQPQFNWTPLKGAY